jgi:translocation and assembly module TamB
MSPPAPLPSDAQARPLRTGLQLLTPLFVIAALLALLAGALATAGHWLLKTQEGSRWLLSHVPGLQVQGFQGVAWGGNWRADKVRVQWDAGKKSVEVFDAKAQGVTWQWRPQPNVWLGLQTQSLVARQVVVATGPRSALNPVPTPPSIAPPLQLQFGQVRAAELLIDSLAPIRQAALDEVMLDARPKSNFSAERFSFEGFGWAMAGDFRIGNTAPLPLSGHASLRPLQDGEAPRWGAVVDAGGSLGELKLTSILRGRPLPGHEAPALDASATLLPLHKWWLAELKLQTQSLDLTSLSPQAPFTQLSGRAELTGGAGDKPLSAHVQLSNAAPGRWDEQRLPVQTLSLQAQAELKRPDRLDVSRFELQLADNKSAAGRITGNAKWVGTELMLDTVLSNVTPQRLDKRAAAMTLSGPVQTTLRGLPAPDANSRASAAAPAATATPSIRSAQWKLDLQGQLDAAPQAVQLQMEGSWDTHRLLIPRARAQSAGAVLDFAAKLNRLDRPDRVGQGGWQLESNGSVKNFDPQPWWRGDGNTTWRQGPHRLSGEWQFDVRLPADAAQLAGPAWLQHVAGNGTLNLRDSLLAGVPMAADVVLANVVNKNPNEPASGTLRASVRLAGNELQIEGRAEPGGSGDNDRWRADLRAEALAALAPLTRLHPALADWVPRQGSVNATLTSDGRWPRLRSEGTARVAQLQVGSLGVARGTASWRIDNKGDARGDQPVELQLEMTGVQLAKQRADNLRAELRGTLADHHIDIRGALPILPPAWTEQVLGIQVQSGTRAQLQAQGAWRRDTAGGGIWKAHVERLVLGSWDGSSSANAPPLTANSAQWAEASDLNATLQFNAQGELVGLQADPGRLRLAQTFNLRWDEVKVAMAAGTSANKAQWQLKADVEPFALAPLLARARPGMGWKGDLSLGARLNVRAAEKFDAELLFERRLGDLQLVSEEGSQVLGLSDLKFSLIAHEGMWRFTHSFMGKSLGEMSGDVRVQSTPDKRWPAPDSPIEGKIQARVADIGIWSTWVPPGWRLKGEVRTVAALNGSFGDPQFIGDITGSGLGVRNLLRGVNVSDGQLAIKLSGYNAQVENFTFKGGDGSITLVGGVVLGWKPQALLQLKAERFRVLGRIDQQLTASGNAAVILDAEQLKVEGKFTADEGMFGLRQNNAPSLDEDVVVRRPSDANEPVAEAVAPKTSSHVAVALDLDMGQKLRVRGFGVDTELRGQVRFTTPGGRPNVIGTIKAENGSFTGYGQKMEIERGIVAFSGPHNNPRLDILALRPNIDMRVGVAITGNALSPRIRLFSEPEMSDADKLSWLVLGRAPDSLGRNDTALLQRAAIALLAGENEAPTDALMKSLGIDDISLRQGDTAVRETVISIGKQLSRRWYLGYERGVNATTGTWQLTYRIAQRFTLRAQSGLDNALDVIWTWRLQEPNKEPTKEVIKQTATETSPQQAPETGMRKSPASPP